MKRSLLVFILICMFFLLVNAQNTQLEETQQLINLITQEQSYLPRIEKATTKEELEAIRKELEEKDINSDILDTALEVQQNTISPGLLEKNAMNLGVGVVILAIFLLLFLTFRKRFKKDAAKKAREHVQRKLQLAQKNLEEIGVLTRKEEHVEERVRHYAALFESIRRRSKPVEDLLSLSSKRFEDNLEKFEKEYLAIAQNDPHLIPLIKELKKKWDDKKEGQELTSLLRELFSDPAQNIKRIKEIHKELEHIVQEQREDFKKRMGEHAHHLSALVPVPEHLVENNYLSTEQAIKLLEGTTHTTLLELLKQKREILSKLWKYIGQEPLPIAKKETLTLFIKQVESGANADQLAQELNQDAQTFLKQVQEESALWEKLASIETEITLEYANAAKRGQEIDQPTQSQEDPALIALIQKQKEFKELLKKPYTPAHFQQLQHILNISDKPSLLLKRLSQLRPRVEQLEPEQRKRIEQTMQRIEQWIKGDFITGELLIQNAPQNIKATLYDKQSRSAYDLDRAGDRFIYHDVLEGKYTLIVEHEGNIAFSADVNIPPKQPIIINYAKVTGRGTEKQRAEAMNKVAQAIRKVEELKQQQRISQEQEATLKQHLQEAKDTLADKDILSKASHPQDYEEIVTEAQKEVEEAQAQQPLTLAQRILQNAEKVTELLSQPHTSRREQELKQAIGSDAENVGEILKALKKDPYKKQIKNIIEDLKKWSKSKDVEVRIQVSSPNLRPAQRIDFKGRWGVIRRVELKDGSAIIGIPKGIYKVRLFCMKESTLTSCKNVLKLNIQEDTTLRLETDGEIVKQV